MKEAVHHVRPALVVILWSACLWLAGCSQLAEAQPIVAATLSVTPIATTMATQQEIREVTRQVPVTTVVTVTNVIMIEATPQPPVACAPDDLSQADQIVVGAILPLSIPGSMGKGFAMQTALNLAVEDANMAGGIDGKPIRLITYDSGGDPQRGALFAERLIVQDCVSVLVGVYHPAVGLAVKEVAHRYGVPLILTDIHSDEFADAQYPEVFRIAPALSKVAQAPGQWMAEVGDYNEDGLLSAVFIVENNAHGALQTEQANLWMPAYVTEHEVLTVDLPTTDFSPTIARIVTKETLPDVIFVRITGDSGLDLLRQLQEAGIGPQKGTLLVAGADALDDERLWQLAPDSAFTVVQKLGPWSTALTPVGAAFAERFAQFYDSWPEPQAFAAYDALRLAVDGLTRAETISPQDLVVALEGSNIELASGRYHFPYGHSNPPDGVSVPHAAWNQWPDYPILFLQYTENGQSSASLPIIWPEMYRTGDQPLLR